MLRAGELARIQAVNASWLPNTATITRPDGGQTTDGFPDATPTAIATSVACRAEPDGKQGSEGVAGSGVLAGDDWFIVFGHDVATLKPMDTITVSGVGVFEAQSVTSGRGVPTDVVARCVRLESV